jgi:hypothetical protein
MVVFLITAVALPLLLTEFGDWCPWLAARLVHWAARHLGDPASCRRYEEEWIANLNEVPGKLARLVAAFGYLAYMPRMRRSIRSRMTHPLQAASPELPAIHNLPPMPESFIGRDKEVSILLERLSAAADDTTRCRSIYLVGMAAIGKTTLAITCANLLKGAFPDGQLFARPGPTADACLHDLLLALGVPPAHIPASQSRKNALLQARVSERRILLVLDEFEPDQVTALFRNEPPCPLLITSRRPPDPLTAIGEVFALPPLTSHEARELLRNKLGRRLDAEPEAVLELVAILGGHPLALMVTASLLARNPSRTIASVADELRQEAPSSDKTLSCMLIAPKRPFAAP